jgi:hypothetical protein
VLIGVGADRGGDQGCGAETSTVCCWFHPFPRGDIFISFDEFNPPLGAFPGSGGGGAALRLGRPGAGPESPLLPSPGLGSPQLAQNRVFGRNTWPHEHAFADGAAAIIINRRINKLEN